MDRIEGYGPPTDKTVGAVGQKYYDLDTKAEYVCTEAYKLEGYKLSKIKYEWEPTGKVDIYAMITDHTHEVGDIDNYDDTLATDAELKEAVDELKDMIDTGMTIGDGIPVFAEIVE